MNVCVGCTHRCVKDLSPRKVNLDNAQMSLFSMKLEEMRTVSAITQDPRFPPTITTYFPTPCLDPCPWPSDRLLFLMWWPEACGDKASRQDHSGRGMDEVTSALLGPAVRGFKGSQCPQPSSFTLVSEPTQALPILPSTLHFPFLPTHRYCRCDSPVKALSPISVNLLELSNLERQRQS